MRWLLTFLLVSSWCFAGDTLDKDLSVSSAYESRSLISNPAALGYQTELNGAELLTNFSYGFQQGLSDEFQTTFSYGILGFGVERLSVAEGRFVRYGFGIGKALTPYLFSGVRYSFTSSDAATLSSVNTLDLGLQVRPSRYAALGLFLKKLNRPEVAGVRHNLEIGIGASFRPLERLELSFDGLLNSHEFGEKTAYFGNVRFETWKGIYLSGGYHTEYKWKMGLQINLGPASFYGVARPEGGTQNLIVGFSASPTPYRSTLGPDTALVVRINDELSEMPVSGGVFGKDRPAFFHLLQTLEKAQQDEKTKLVAIQLEEFPLGLAAAQELHEAILRVRKSGKRVEVFLSNAGVKEYLIASAAEKIYMEPTSELRVLGLRSERYFLKGTLEKIGVEGEFLAKGDYKSAPEVFTRTESSPRSKEEILRELGHAEDAILKMLQPARGVTRAKWDALLKEALLGAEEAKSAALIDGVAHFQDVSREWKLIKRETMRERSDRLALNPRVSVVIASGDILQKRIPILSFAGHPQVVPERMEKHLKAAGSDVRTRAVVLRVNSPGGEVVASDQIANMVANLNREKPVMVSMGDVAASGGYFISAPATAIYAKPLTLTGSVGVFLGKFNLGNLYKKIELHKEILSRAPYANLMSEDHPWSKEEKAIMAKRLNQYYEGFVSFVAKNRRITKEQAEEAAQGRVWLGEEAKKKKLVDWEGGYYEAVRGAAEAAGMNEGEYDVAIVQSSGGLFGLLGDGDLLLPDPASSLALSLLPEPVVEEMPWLIRMKESPFLYLSTRKAIK